MTERVDAAPILDVALFPIPVLATVSSPGGAGLRPPRKAILDLGRTHGKSSNALVATSTDAMG